MKWWTTLKGERHLHKDPPITYWNDLRGALRCRDIPSYYNRKLIRLHQNSECRRILAKDGVIYDKGRDYGKK